MRIFHGSHFPAFLKRETLTPVPQITFGLLAGFRGRIIEFGIFHHPDD